MDWKKIKAEYIAGGTSYRKLCDKYGCSRTTLQRKAKDENWLGLRSQAEAKTESKIIDAVSNDAAEKAVNIIDIADKLLKKIEELVGIVGDADSIKKLTSAIKDLKDIKGIKSDADMREQEVRIAKLQKEAQAETNGSTEVSITFGMNEEQNRWAE